MKRREFLKNTVLMTGMSGLCLPVFADGRHFLEHKKLVEEKIAYDLMRNKLLREKLLEYKFNKRSQLPEWHYEEYVICPFCEYKHREYNELSPRDRRYIGRGGVTSCDACRRWFMWIGCVSSMIYKKNHFCHYATFSIELQDIQSVMSDYHCD